MYRLFLVALLSLFVACGSSKFSNSDKTFTLAFGSCNKTELTNDLWDDVLKQHPKVWIWGGDNIYADTENMNHLAKMYAAQDTVAMYQEVKRNMEVIGTWDDHDYGLNDGGAEFVAKRQSQQQFLDFLHIPKTDERRKRPGIYAAHDYEDGKVKVLVLDTRYFRTALTPDTLSRKRFTPNAFGEGTMLGEQQWEWLEDQFKTNKATFTILVSSIQFLSDRHGFECWGNFPHEVERLERLIQQTNTKGVIILSGDRHISEFSRKYMEGVSYPLVDFTSSGLTHVYEDFKGEENVYRVGNVVNKKSFGLVRLNLETRTAHFEMIGNGGELLQSLDQRY